MNSDSTAVHLPLSSLPVRPIGGFLPIELPCTPRADAILRRWTAGGTWLGFGNARSAIVHVLEISGARRLWLPAYFCAHTAAALGRRIPVAYYPVDAGLHHPADVLRQRLAAGDAVLVVCFFGSPAGESWRALAEERPAVVWIEDRAHALWPGAEPVGPWVVYSPRKLLGVPDGGVLVSHGERLRGVARDMRRDAAFLGPALIRFEDSNEEENERWYRAHCEREETEEVSATAMSRLTTQILASTPLEPLIQRRTANHALLRERLEAALPPLAGSASGTPWFYATRVKGADAVARRLHQQRLFVSRLWREPADGMEGTEARRLADELLLLPCDHRYGADDMTRLAGAVLHAL